MPRASFSRATLSLPSVSPVKVIGVTEVARQKAVEDARNFKAAGVDINIIAKCVGLSVEEIEKL